jgi:hypothetical protein
MKQEVNMEALASELEVTVDYLIEEFLIEGEDERVSDLP